MAKLKETKGDKYVFEMDTVTTVQIEYTAAELDERINHYTSRKSVIEESLSELDSKLTEYQALKDLIQ